MQKDNTGIDQVSISLKVERPPGLLGSWRKIIHNISRYRFFLRQLVRINMLVGFKKSFIGLLWLFILPVIAVFVWILLQGAGIVDPGKTDIPYPAYVLLSTSIWGFFIEIYRTVSQVLSGNGKIMIMTKFPHEVLVAEKIIVHLIRFAIPLAVNLVALLLFGIKFSWLSLLFPFTLIPLLLLGVSIGLIVALLRVVAVDISSLIDEFMRFLMYLTPIVYAPRVEIGWLSGIVEYNPLTYLIGFSRDILTTGSFYEPQKYLIWTGISILFFIVVVRFFFRVESRMLERLINN
ncbi:MAG: ABC transporter permease [Bacteroidetes bacterium]|nr:ABC transporter permease [Bacteroidota bacterium]